MHFCYFVRTAQGKFKLLSQNLSCVLINTFSEFQNKLHIAHYLQKWPHEYTCYNAPKLAWYLEMKNPQANLSKDKKQSMHV